MVKAGVYLTARSFPLFVYNSYHGEEVLLFIACIGGFTAIFAASQALNNMNIVAAWISADTVVGPAIASGSQSCRGN